MIATFLKWAGMPEETQLDGWTVYQMKRGDKVIGLGAMRGTEIHFAVAPDEHHRAIQRDRFRQFLGALMEARGYLTTRARAGDMQANRFLTRVGFKKTWSALGVDHYMLTRLPFSKEN